MLAVSGCVHGELEVLQAVVLRQEGHEAAQGVGRRSSVCEDLGQVGFPTLRVGDVLGYGYGQWCGVHVARIHFDVVTIKLDERLGGGRGGGGCSD